jgi:hypothetical protein
VDANSVSAVFFAIATRRDAYFGSWRVRSLLGLASASITTLVGAGGAFGTQSAVADSNIS